MHMYFEATALLYILTVFTLAVFFVGTYANIYLWRKGKAPSLHHRLLTGPIIKALILDALFQAQLFRQSAVRWFMHICIFWGFLGLLAHTTLLAIMSHLVPADSSLAHSVFLGPGKPFLDVWGDLWGLILLIGLLIAFARRYVVRAVQLDTILMDNAALIFLFAIALLLAEYEAVSYIAYATGDTDISIQVFARNNNELFTFVTEVIGKISGVRRTHISFVPVKIKDDHVWPIPSSIVKKD